MLHRSSYEHKTHQYIKQVLNWILWGAELGRQRWDDKWLAVITRAVQQRQRGATGEAKIVGRRWSEDCGVQQVKRRQTGATGKAMTMQRRVESAVCYSEDFLMTRSAWSCDDFHIVIVCQGEDQASMTEDGRLDQSARVKVDSKPWFFLLQSLVMWCHTATYAGEVVSWEVD